MSDDTLRSVTRLAALADTGLLDSPPEPRLEGLVRLAARFLGAPVSLVSLVDADREVFLAAVGLGEPWASRREMPLSHSFCQHVVTANAALVVSDARTHPLVAHNEAIEDLGFVAYAGVPLTTESGETLGALCAIEPRPRKWSSADLAVLSDLAAGVMAEIELAIARRAAEVGHARLADAHGRVVAVLDCALDCIVTMGADGCVVEFNPAAERTFGYTAEEARGRELAELIVPPALRDAHRAGLARLARGEPSRALGRRLELPAMRADGSEFPVELTITRADVPDGPLFVGYLRDLTERRRAEAALRDSEALNGAVVASLHEGVIVLDTEGCAVAVNDSGLRIMELPRDAVIGRRAPFQRCWLEDGTPIGHSRSPSRVALEDFSSDESVVLRIERPAGNDGWVSLNARPLLGDAQELRGLVWSFEDITARRSTELEVQRLAFQDPLTGLPNRTHLQPRLERALERAGRAGRPAALLCLDLDEFKLVNDTLGHAAGDKLLTLVAGRLKPAIRDGDLLARHGGDEFALLLTQLDGDADETCQAIARRLLDALRDPFSIDGHDFEVGASIGIAVFPRDGGDPEALVKSADQAMYRAKRAGRGGYLFPGPDEAASPTRLTLSARLRRAIAQDELLLHYQPLFDLATGQAVGVEALVRWNDPERGLVAPGEFIPVAERTGLIDDLGDWVFHAAAAQAGAWRSEGLRPYISVNASPVQLKPGFAERLARVLRDAGVEPDQIVVEVTETALMQEHDRVRPVVDELRAIGVKLALDDFGAGFSSLGRLRDLPTDVLKVDRSLLRGVPDDHEATEVLLAILALGRAATRTVVVEGIETEPQRALLARHPGVLGQGFGLHRPAPAATITALLSAGAGSSPQMPAAAPGPGAPVSSHGSA